MQQYNPYELVQVSGNLTLNGALITNGLVGIEVNTSSGLLVARTVPASQPPSETPYVFTEYIAPCDASGNPTFSFQTNTIAYFKVSLSNLNLQTSYPVYVTVNVYDNTSTPLGVQEFYETLIKNTTSIIIFPFLIPSTAAPGTATVYGNVYSNWPSLGGTPYVREVNATFQIVDDPSGAGQTTENQSPKPQSTGTTDTSNYGTAFRIYIMALPGTYSIYVTSSYEGQSAFNSTEFSVVHGPPHILGDFGGAIATPPYYQFFKFDGKVGADDVVMFVLCLRGLAPADAMYLGDLGCATSSPPYYQFFKFDGIINAADVDMFVRCLRGTGPTGPVAIFTWSPLSSKISNQLVTFNASRSYDDQYGTIASYTWVFGDGNTTTVTNPIVQHTFTTPGNYTVTLTIIDSNLQPDSTSEVISV